MIPEQIVLTVSELTRRIKHSLEIGFGSVTLQGELSNVKQHTSGHVYFTLKDEAAQISGVLWRSRAANLSFNPEDGLKVIVTGRVTVYEPRGQYQIDVLTMRPAGVGELQMAFEYLKRKLAAEGLFDESHKKPLPEYPERIGIVTSPTGAAIHDILNILRRRFPCIEVVLYPVRVQGIGASEDIVRALDDLNSYGKVDAIIVGRGGGSLEDLWAFNEENVARAVYRSRIPVVSAVGHEIDFSIVDFVADLRAPTPSAAAELVVPERSSVLEVLRNSCYTMHERVVQILDDHKRTIIHILKSHAFNKPIDLLRQFSQRVDDVDRGMATAMKHKLAMVRSITDALHHRISALDPGLMLRRGYTIIYKDNAIVPSSTSLASNDVVDIRFHDGTVPSKVL
jgi:exodeoxyribonuclease VII large subunit